MELDIDDIIVIHIVASKHDATISQQPSSKCEGKVRGVAVKQTVALKVLYQTVAHERIQLRSESGRDNERDGSTLHECANCHGIIVILKHLLRILHRLKRADGGGATFICDYHARNLVLTEELRDSEKGHCLVDSCVVLDLERVFYRGPHLYPTVRHVGMCVTGLLPVTVLLAIGFHTERGAHKHASVSSLSDTSPSTVIVNAYTIYSRST